MTTHNSLFT